MAKLLYQTALPYWLFAVLLLKLAVVEVTHITAPLIEPIDLFRKPVVMGAVHYGKMEPSMATEHETHSEEVRLWVKRLGAYLAPRLERAFALVTPDRGLPNSYVAADLARYHQC